MSKKATMFVIALSPYFSVGLCVLHFQIWPPGKGWAGLGDTLLLMSVYGGATVGLMLVGLVAYLVHTWRINYALKQSQKILWTLFFLGLLPVATFAYWYFWIRQELPDFEEVMLGDEEVLSDVFD